ncbi:MAG TPA: hypothetical protein VFF86_05940, partial [Candidatus Methylomirabilis sp.]|nr:hypothetical protein [Candidatus Methylomirabilis sp.]
MMTITETSFVPALVSPDFDSFAVRQAVAGFLAGYGDTTRQAYSLDLRQWLRWCDNHDLRVFDVRRAHIELFCPQSRTRRQSKSNRRQAAIDGGRVLPILFRG